MKAVVFTGKGAMEATTLPDPEPRPGEVVLHVVGCGVCGTDVHIFHGDLKEGVVPPVVLGHEIVGEIVALGAGVTQWRVGQTVAVDPVVGCGRCEFCQLGKPNLCAASTVIGYSRHGGYAEYAAVPASHVVALSPKVGLKGGILVETLACVLNGYERLGFEAGRTAMVLGAGAVGLLWNQLLRCSPSAFVIQSEPVAFRRGLARELGADLVIDPSDGRLVERVRAALPEGVDYIVDASGNPEAIAEALPLVRKSGTFLIFGVCPAGSEVRIDPHEVYQKEMRIVASKMPPRKLNPAARLLESGKIDYERIVTTVRGLNEVVPAIHLFTAGRDQNVKLAIDPKR